MQSPPIEWAIFGAHFVALDYLRSRGDADHDTASEVIRNAVDRHPHGRALLRVGLVLGGIVLHEHLDRPLRR